MKLSCEYIPSPNFTRGGIVRVERHIVHSTQGGFAGAVSWLCNPHNKVGEDPKKRSSAHFVIGKDGRRVQLVDTADRAWHATSPHWNARALGYELEYTDLTYEAFYPDEQLKALALTIRELEEAKAVPTGLPIIGHSQVAKKSDPGPTFPFWRIYELIKTPEAAWWESSWAWAKEIGLVTGDPTEDRKIVAQMLFRYDKLKRGGE